MFLSAPTQNFLYNNLFNETASCLVLGLIKIFEFLKKKKAENLLKEIDMNNLPRHVGIIMDGNGRWAKKRGLPRSAGHRAGAQNLKTISEFAGEMGIKYITAYAFSTENWKRPKEEVDELMNLLLSYLRDKKILSGKKVTIKVIGDRSALSDEINKEIDVIEDYTKNNDGMVMYLAINYGGRQEIVKSIKDMYDDIKEGKIEKADICENLISERIYTPDVPDADLIIRPSGEKRLSNFLMWQSAYSEFWFSDINWPDFTTADFTQAILDYQGRNRRFGGV
ncbi:MAG: isoprenyl transferase [Clostridia bacterium]|nr:isoprenyl transferase [Clostridia bacterium]